MTVGFADSANLSQDPTFQARVRIALVTYFGTILSENATTTPLDKERRRYISMLQGTTTTANLTAAAQLFANVVAGDTTVLADATAAGTVNVTSGNAATQQALITDAHISNAIASQFNQFLTIN